MPAVIVSEAHDPVTWRRSSWCANGECVEVGRQADYVLVKDSKSDGAPHAFTRAEWDAFVAGVKAGEFDYQTL